MEAESELHEAGFKSFQPKELLSLRRNYSLICSPRSASIRTEIERVSKEITKMIQWEWYLYPILRYIVFYSFASEAEFQINYMLNAILSWFIFGRILARKATKPDEFRNE